jgi:hypothetical protein
MSASHASLASLSGVADAWRAAVEVLVAAVEVLVAAVEVLVAAVIAPAW